MQEICIHIGRKWKTKKIQLCAFRYWIYFCIAKHQIDLHHLMLFDPLLTYSFLMKKRILITSFAFAAVVRVYVHFVSRAPNGKYDKENLPH